MPSRKEGSRRVLVTGGAGFIGSHVCERFLASAYNVLALDDLSTGRTENVPRAARLEEADITDMATVQGLFSDFRPHVVCHLAAQSSVTVSVSSPELDFDANVRGTFNILEASSNYRAPVVFASTGGALYGDTAPVPTAEDELPQPLAPYGASKLAGEAYVATWGRLFEIPNVILRLGNVYGPRQSPFGEAGVVALFSRRLHLRESPIVYGNGEQTRDYVHAADVADAFLATAEAGRAGVFNVGWGRERSVLELLCVLQDIAGTSLEPRFEPLRRGELERSALNSDRLRDLGWEPHIPFEEGLAATYPTYT